MSDLFDSLRLNYSLISFIRIFIKTKSRKQKVTAYPLASQFTRNTSHFFIFFNYFLPNFSALSFAPEQSWNFIP